MLSFLLPCAGVAPDSGGSGGGLSGGAVVGIVFAAFFFVFVILPFAYSYGRGFWHKRHEYGWYRTITCESCRHGTRRSGPPAVFNLNRQDTADVEVTTTVRTTA